MMQFDYISPKDKLPSYKQEVLIFSIYNDFDVMYLDNDDEGDFFIGRGYHHLYIHEVKYWCELAIPAK